MEAKPADPLLCDSLILWVSAAAAGGSGTGAPVGPPPSRGRRPQAGGGGRGARQLRGGGRGAVGAAGLLPRSSGLCQARWAAGEVPERAEPGGGWHIGMAAAVRPAWDTSVCTVKGSCEHP